MGVCISHGRRLPVAETKRNHIFVGMSLLADLSALFAHFKSDSVLQVCSECAASVLQRCCKCAASVPQVPLVAAHYVYALRHGLGHFEHLNL